MFFFYTCTCTCMYAVLTTNLFGLDESCLFVCLFMSGAVLISRWIDPLNTTTESIVEKEISTIAEQTAQQLIPSLVGDDSRVAECTTQTGGGDTVTRDPPPSAAGVVRGMGLPRKDILEVIEQQVCLW